MKNETLHCHYCGEKLDLTQVYITSLYCSAKCRVSASRLIKRVKILKQLKKFNIASSNEAEGVTVEEVKADAPTF